MKPATMRAAETADPPVKTRPEVDVETLSQIDPSTLEDSFVYVHCYFQNSWRDMLIRIWRSTYLVDKSSGVKSPLVHAENISIAPAWTRVPDGQTYSFLLIFSALPKACTLFDLVEEIDQPGGFHIANISRNTTDVYHVDI